MEYTIMITIARSIAVFVLALLLTRLMGRKLISHMTFFDFIAGITMGSLIANSMTDSSNENVSAITALIILSFLIIGVGYLHIKSIKARKIINSEPVTLVHDGTIIEENMKSSRLTIDELMMKMREKNAFSLADVEFAIMETDGELSILPKADKKPVTPSQLNIIAASEGLMKDIIIDGNLLEENLKGTGLDKDWINAELNNQKIKDISEVFYAGIYAEKKLHISRKYKGKQEKHGKYGIE